MTLSLLRSPGPRSHRAAQQDGREGGAGQPLPQGSTAGGAEERVGASSPHTVLLHSPAAGEGLGVRASLQVCGISSGPG